MSDQAEEQLSKDSDSDFVSFLRDLRDPRPLPGSSICEASDSAEGVLNQSTTHDGTLPYAAGLGVDPQAVQKSAETTNTRPKRFRNPEVNRRAAKRFRERHKVFSPTCAACWQSLLRASHYLHYCFTGATSEVAGRVSCKPCKGC